jgi:hypothetical protein
MTHIALSFVLQAVQEAAWTMVRLLGFALQIYS